MNEQRLRKRIIETCLAMSANGLNKGTAGNLSVRYNDGFLVTPSGLPYGETYPADIVFVNFAGEPTGRCKPSSEWRFHRDILRARPETNVVLHAHSPFATSLACLRKETGVSSFLSI